MAQLVKNRNPLVILYSSAEKRYIVHNTNKSWSEGHTHIKTLKQADYICDCVIKSKVPQRVNKYFLVSIRRVATDPAYISKIDAKIKSFNGAKGYYNEPKNKRK